MPPLNAIPVPAVSLEGGAIAPGRTLPGAAGPASGTGFDALIASLLGGSADGEAPDGTFPAGAVPGKNSALLPARPDQTAEGASLAAALMQLAGWQPVPQPPLAQQAPAGTEAPLDILPAASTPPVGSVPAISIPAVAAAAVIPVADAMSPPLVPANPAIPPQAEDLGSASLLPESAPVGTTAPVATGVLPVIPAPVSDMHAPPVAAPPLAPRAMSALQPVADGNATPTAAPAERVAQAPSNVVTASDGQLPPQLNGMGEAPVAVEATAVATPAVAPAGVAVAAPPAAAAPADTPRLRPVRAAAAIAAAGDPLATNLPGPGDASAIPASVKAGKAADGDDPVSALRPAPQGAAEQPASAPAPVAVARPDPLPEPVAFPVDQTAATAVTAAREVAASAGTPAARRATGIHLSPAAQLTGRIEQAVSEGRTTLTVRLDPETLGRVEVKLELQDGRVTAHIAAERPATLDLLQRDARLLERAVEQGGLQLSGGGLQFSLRDGAGQWTEAQAGNRRGGLAYGMAAAEPAADPLSPTLYTSDSLVDIQI